MTAELSRRSFLTLLVAGPALANFAPTFTPLPEPTVIFPPDGEPLSTKFRTARYILPFMGDSFLEPGRVAVIEARPQLLFRPDRLMLEGADVLELLNVSANGEPMLEESVPGWLFSPAAFGVRLEFDCIRPGQRCALALRNLGKARVRLHAAMVGLVAEAQS